MAPHDPSQKHSWVRSSSGLVLLAFLAIAAFFLITEYWGMLLGALPYVLSSCAPCCSCSCLAGTAMHTPIIRPISLGHPRISLMHTNTPASGLWSLVIINAAVFIIFATWYKAARFLQSGRLNPSPIMTHRFPLAEFDQGHAPDRPRGVWEGNTPPLSRVCVGHMCGQHAGQGERDIWQPSTRTYRREQPAYDRDVAAFPDTTAGRHPGRVEPSRGTSDAGAAALWGGPHRLFCAVG